MIRGRRTRWSGRPARRRRATTSHALPPIRSHAPLLDLREAAAAAAEEARHEARRGRAVAWGLWLGVLDGGAGACSPEADPVPERPIQWVMLGGAAAAALATGCGRWRSAARRAERRPRLITDSRSRRSTLVVGVGGGAARRELRAVADPDRRRHRGTRPRRARARAASPDAVDAPARESRGERRERAAADPRAAARQLEGRSRPGLRVLAAAASATCAARCASRGAGRRGGRRRSSPASLVLASRCCRASTPTPTTCCRCTWSSTCC